MCPHEKKAKSQNQAQNQRCDHKVLDGLRENNHEDRNRSNGLVWKWVQAGTRFLSLRVILYVFIFCESAQNRLTFTNTQTPENSKTGRVYEHKHLWTEGSWLPDPSPTALSLFLALALALVLTFSLTHIKWGMNFWDHPVFATNTQNSHYTQHIHQFPSVETPWPSRTSYLSCEPF